MLKVLHPLHPITPAFSDYPPITHLEDPTPPTLLCQPGLQLPKKQQPF